jgi:hypothetical protein
LDSSNENAKSGHNNTMTTGQSDYGDLRGSQGKVNGYRSSLSQVKKKGRKMHRSHNSIYKATNRHRSTRQAYVNYIYSSSKLQYKELPFRDDFNPETVDEGINEIDLTIDLLEQNMPKDIYEIVDYDIDSMIKSNRELRDKIKEITTIVKSCIKRAAEFKKSIATHRDPPNNPEVSSKQKQISTYQKSINTLKKYIDNLNTKIENLSQNDKISSCKSTIKKHSRKIK